MIEGIKPTVSGEKLKKLVLDRAAHHESRVQVYAEQIANFKAAAVEAANFTGGDPNRALESKMAEHEYERDRCLFLADNLNLDETYILQNEDLYLLGVVRRGY